MQLMDKYWHSIIIPSPYFIKISLVIVLCLLSAPGSHPGYHITCSCYVSFDSFSDFPFDDLDSFVEYYEERPSTGICLIFFL